MPRRHKDHLFRLVDGAIRNFGHAHPEAAIDPRWRMSIAKRVAGTLRAHYRLDALASVATPPSDEA